MNSYVLILTVIFLLNVDMDVDAWQMTKSISDRGISRINSEKSTRKPIMEFLKMDAFTRADAPDDDLPVSSCRCRKNNIFFISLTIFFYFHPEVSFI